MNGLPVCTLNSLFQKKGKLFHLCGGLEQVQEGIEYISKTATCTSSRSELLSGDWRAACRNEGNV